MRCRIFIAANLGASWSGGSGSTSRRTGRSPAAPPLSQSLFPIAKCRTSFSFSTSRSSGCMLWIEARRYRFYDAFRARVRMLEAHFLVPMVMENRDMLQGEWKKLVCEDLILPSFKISETRGRRAPVETQLRFHFHPDFDRVDDKDFFARHRADQRCRIVLSRAADRSHPVVVGGDDFRRHFHHCHRHHYLRRQKSSGEISEFGTHRSLWRI